MTMSEEARYKKYSEALESELKKFRKALEFYAHCNIAFDGNDFVELKCNDNSVVVPQTFGTVAREALKYEN